MALQDPAVIGVDGCCGGWLAAIWRQEGITIRLFSTFADVLREPAQVIAVDMPMGLPQLHGRTAEREARKALKGRASSIFAVPSRSAIAARDYAEACRINQRNSVPARKLSKQVFHLFPKLREVDSLLTPGLQNRVYEAHPELAFCVMNGGTAVAPAKKTPEGAQARIQLLKLHGMPILPFSAFDLSRKSVSPDDILDACAAAWTARRILNGNALQCPAHEERDARGLLMRIHT